MSEEDLIDGCVREDENCQRLLYEKYAAKMFAVSMRYCSSREEAEDVLQEAFIRIYDKIASFRKEGSFEGWIRRVVVNTSLKSKDKKYYQRELGGVEDYDIPVSAGIIEQMSARDIQSLMAKLPEGYRTVFNLYAVEGYSHKEIGQMLGVSEITSRSQYHRAKASLKEMINQLMERK
jgi:RNA polymerase sigma-70 factor (ECF subfamily)